MEFVRICGVLLIGLSAALLLREKHRLCAFLCSAAAVVIVLVKCANTSAVTAVSTITGYVASSGFSGYAAVLIKALGISYIAVFTSEICKGAGETMLADAAIVCGKAELIILCLPLAAQLLECAESML